jgi:hypothetical protein
MTTGASIAIRWPRSSEGADARGVCEYLSETQSQRMEIPARADQLTDVGERVADWYAVEMQG